RAGGEASCVRAWRSSRRARAQRGAGRPRPALSRFRRRAIPLPLRWSRTGRADGQPDVCRVRQARVLRACRGRWTDAPAAAPRRLAVARRNPWTPRVSVARARTARTPRCGDVVRVATHAAVSRPVRSDRASSLRDRCDPLARVVCVWFALTVLRGRRYAFAVGALVAGFAATLTLNIVNPDALI